MLLAAFSVIYLNSKKLDNNKEGDGLWESQYKLVSLKLDRINFGMIS